MFPAHDTLMKTRTILLLPMLGCVGCLAVIPDGEPLPDEIEEIPPGLLDVDRCSSAPELDISSLHFEPVPDFENEVGECYMEYTENSGDDWVRERDWYLGASGEIAHYWGRSGNITQSYANSLDGSLELRGTKDVETGGVEPVGVDVYVDGVLREYRAISDDGSGILTFYEYGDGWQYEEMYFRDGTCERVRWSFSEYDDAGRLVQRQGSNFGSHFNRQPRWSGNSTYSDSADGSRRVEVTWDFDVDPPRVVQKRFWDDLDSGAPELSVVDYTYDSAGRPLLIDAGRVQYRWNWDCLGTDDASPRIPSSGLPK